jgi:hypothetical protein
MQRSITARYAVRPAASFVRPAGDGRERRLGLHSSLSFQRAATRLTILRSSRGGLHISGWSPVTTTRPNSAHCGVVRPAITICWADSGRPRADRRSSLATAPWRG